MSNKIALITGATAGIGEATARLLADNNIDLIICGRREERLRKLKEALSEKVRVHPLVFDLRDREAVETAIHTLPEDFEEVDFLINNAGNAHGMDLIHKGDPDDWDFMIDLNLKGVLYMTRAVVPKMVERGHGHIVNLGSMAGKEVYPNGNVYCATKFGVDALTQGMRQDLLGTGVRVTSINPGLVETEFSLVRFKGDDERANRVYRGYLPLQAQDVAEAIWFALSRPSHVNVADMLLLPTDQANSRMVNKK